MAIIHYLVFILTVYLELITINYDRSIIQSFFFFCLFFLHILSLIYSYFFPSFFCFLFLSIILLSSFYQTFCHSILLSIFLLLFSIFSSFHLFFFSFYYSSFCHPILPYSSVFPLFFSPSFLFCTKIKIEDRKKEEW